jgi:hypothetical protein
VVVGGRGLECCGGVGGFYNASDAMQKDVMYAGERCTCGDAGRSGMCLCLLYCSRVCLIVKPAREQGHLEHGETLILFCSCFI